MRRGVIACFERGALNLRGNRRLLLTLLFKSGLNLAVATATIVPVLRMLDLDAAWLGLLGGQPEVFAERLTEWGSGLEMPAQLPWVLALLVLSGVIQMIVQSFFDAGALGILAAGDYQAPDKDTAGRPLTADWFETFDWREFVGRGGQLVWRLLFWRLGVGFVLLLVTTLPFVLLGVVVEGTRGVALVAGCFAVGVGLILVSIVWLWWWVVEMHMSWLPVRRALRRGSRSFVRRGGSWMALTGVAGMLLIAALIPVVLLVASLQMVSGGGLTSFVTLQVVSGLLQGIVFGAVMFLVWGAAIALSRGDFSAVETVPDGVSPAGTP